jgi:hypothetical protein
MEKEQEYNSSAVNLTRLGDVEVLIGGLRLTIASREFFYENERELSAACASEFKNGWGYDPDEDIALSNNIEDKAFTIERGKYSLGKVRVYSFNDQGEVTVSYTSNEYDDVRKRQIIKL